MINEIKIIENSISHNLKEANGLKKKKILKPVLRGILTLMLALMLSGCVNENTDPYTAEQVIRKVKKTLNFDADIICTETTIVREKPWSSVTYTLYDQTTDFEFTATASVLQANGSVVPLPNRRELRNTYFSSYIDHLALKVQSLTANVDVTFSPAKENHSGYDTILISEEKQIMGAAELFEKMVSLYDLERFKFSFGRAATCTIEFAYLAPDAQDFQQRISLGYYKVTPINKFYEYNTDPVGAPLFNHHEKDKTISENLAPELMRMWNTRLSS